jgi:predicted permease
VAPFRNHLAPVFRRLARTPLFTGLTIATLPIGIGANTAIFSVINGVLLQPLPYPESGRLIGVWHTAPGLNIPRLVSSPAHYFTYREEGRAFTGVGLWTTNAITITGTAEPERVPGLLVTDGVLGILMAQPLLGRLFTREDDLPGRPLTAILSYDYWQSHFGGDPAAVGRTIIADSRPRQIIGVLPRRFRFLDTRVSVIVPLQLNRADVFLGNYSYLGIARLRPGVTLAQASTDVARMITLMPDKFTSPRGMGVRVFREARIAPVLHPLKEDVVGDAGNVLWILMGTIGMVLLIACANVANLLLVRAEGRRQELAVRAALGAGWRDLARDLLVESLTLGLAGGLLGAGLAYGAVRLLIAIGPGRLPRIQEIAVDPLALGFTLAISAASGLFFGIIPVFKYARPQAGGLREGGRTSSQGRERHRTRALLAMAQVALALVLLVAAGLMIRTFQALRHVQPGFTGPDQVQTFFISIPRAQVPDPDRATRMFADIVGAIQAIPGVAAAGLSAAIPTDGSSWDPVFAEDHTYAEGKLPPMRRFNFIAPGYFRAMGSPLIAGRDLTWTDIFDRRPVAIVSENLARDFWGSAGAAIGKRVRDNPNGVWREVVGVASDLRFDGPDQPAPTMIYWPYRMDAFQGNARSLRSSLFAVIRSSRAGTEGLTQDLRKAVWSINSDLPLANLRTLAEVWDRAMARTSFTLVMLAIAGAMALLLGIIGIYGVVAYSVSQRTREIGIRMALGAQHGAVRRMFVRQGLTLAAMGIVCGLVAAAALTRWIEKVLFGVKAIDGLTYVAVGLVLLAFAALASYAPARRASLVDPADALRAE